MTPVKMDDRRVERVGPVMDALTESREAPDGVLDFAGSEEPRREVRHRSGPPPSRKHVPGRKSPGVTFRKWNRILHRDLGYLAAGLTIVYAISGVAVNHVRDWNPNFDIVHQTMTVDPMMGDLAEISDGYILSVLTAAGIHEAPRGTFRPDPETLRIFVEEGTVEVNLRSGAALVELVEERPILRPMNFLHLNHARELWTWVADLFAVTLLFLAISGLFMIRGRKGITGRGAWLTAAGVVIPIVFLLMYF